MAARTTRNEGRVIHTRSLEPPSIGVAHSKKRFARATRDRRIVADDSGEPVIAAMSPIRQIWWSTSPNHSRKVIGVERRALLIFEASYTGSSPPVEFGDKTLQRKSCRSTASDLRGLPRCSGRGKSTGPRHQLPWIVKAPPEERPSITHKSRHD